MLDLLDTLAVRELVASLPRGEQALARLLMSGHSSRAAAAVLGISARAVCARLANIRRHFRNAA